MKKKKKRKRTFKISVVGYGAGGRRDEKKDLGRAPAILFQHFHSGLEVWDTLIHNFIALIRC